MAGPVVELLAQLGATFDQLGVRWYLFGAQAAILYGSPRLTADVDVTVVIGGERGEDFAAQGELAFAEHEDGE